MRKSVNTESKWIPAGAVILFLVLWELGVVLGNVQEWILPSPSSILIALYTGWQLMLRHIQATVTTALAGFTLAIAVSFVFVLMMERLPILRTAFYPFIVISQTIPIIFLLPLLFIWFGTGLLPKILIVALVCFFPIVMNLLDGLDKTDPELLDLFRSMGASRWKTFGLVKLPGAMPAFFSGLKIAATYCIMSAVIAEWWGAQYGMGVYMQRAYKTFSTARVFAAILVVVLLSLAVFQGVVAAQALCMPWYRRDDGKKLLDNSR